MKLISNRKYCLLLLTALMLAATPVNCCWALQVGDPFPDFTMTNTLSPDDLASIKARAGKEIALKDIGYQVILIEFPNVYCHTCRGQVPIFNDLYAAIKKDPVLSKSVCMLGAGIQLPKLKL